MPWRLSDGLHARLEQFRAVMVPLPAMASRGPGWGALHIRVWSSQYRVVDFTCRRRVNHFGGLTKSPYMINRSLLLRCYPKS